ncbi:MAG: dihydroneopterin aldolase [Paludibacter sp.]
MSEIKLENMEFHAYHGYMGHEQTLGNTFLVSVDMKLHTELAEITDKLEDTLNYQTVYNVVKEQMEVPSKLIEHVGYRILNAIFNQFPQIQRVKVKISKQNPPLGGKVSAVSFQLEKKR